MRLTAAEAPGWCQRLVRAWWHGRRLPKAPPGTTCACCGGSLLVQPHVVNPYAVDAPQNVLWLCSGVAECHLRIGHGGDWRTWNPTVARHVAQLRRGPYLFPLVAQEAAQAAVRQRP